MVSMARKLLWISLFSFFAFSGCTTTYYVHLAYLPEASTKSPLGKLSPLQVGVEIQDQRGTGNLVGIHSGQAAFQIRSDRDVPSILYDAIRKEFENNGHTVITEKSTSDVIVHVGLKRYWSAYRTYGLTDDVIGTLILDFSIRNPRKGSILFAKPIETDFVIDNVAWRILPEVMATGVLSMGLATPFHAAYVTKRTHETVLNGALDEFIRRFARDPEILKALELAQQEKSQEVSISPSKDRKKARQCRT
jgi:hypothetical protein